MPIKISPPINGLNGGYLILLKRLDKLWFNAEKDLATSPNNIPAPNDNSKFIEFISGITEME